MRTEGNIEQVKFNAKYTGLKVQGNWFNDFNKSEFKEGDYVVVEWQPSKDGKFKNIQTIKFDEGKKVTPITPRLDYDSERQKQIDRTAELRRITDCVLESSACFRELKIKKEEVFEYAHALYNMIGEIENAKVLSTE